MGRTLINVGAVIDATRQINSAKSSVSSVKSSFTQTKNSVDGKIRNRSNIGKRLTTVQNQLSNIDSQIGKIRTMVESGANLYRTTDDRVESWRDDIKNNVGAHAAGQMTGNWASYFISSNGTGDVQNKYTVTKAKRMQTFKEEFKAKYGWEDVLSGAGYVGTVYDLISDIKEGKTWRDFAEAGVETYRFLSDAAKTFCKYKKIGNAVGTKTAMTWWVKNITGVKSLGRASAAKNPFARFANNLTNKTSPFNAQFKNIIANFKGANGVGKAVASWGAVAVNGVLNWFGNKEEQAASNGTMSTGRVIAETVTETVVDTALTYGAGIVVGAAVTAALGTVAAPGVLVVAASGAIVAGINAGVKALTEKTTTEWVSDAILDAGEAIGNAASNAAKSISQTARNVSKSVGKWFKNLSFI